MIKYLGSKRRLVPVLADIARRVGATSALDLFTGTTRVAQAFKQEGLAVTAVDTARYSEMFARCYIETDSRLVDHAALAVAVGALNELPGRPGYFTETFCVASRFVQPANGERIDAVRDAIEDRYRGTALYPILLTSLLEAADRVDSTTGLQMAYVKNWAPRSFRPLDLRVPELLAGPGRPCVAMPWCSPENSARSTSPTSTPVQPAPLLHQLPRLGDAGRVGRARPLRRRLQANRRARPDHQERVQLQARHARRPGDAAARRRVPSPRALLQRRGMGHPGRARGDVLAPRRGRRPVVRLAALRRRTDRHLRPERQQGGQGLPRSHRELLVIAGPGDDVRRLAAAAPLADALVR